MELDGQPMIVSDGEILELHITVCHDLDCPMHGKSDHYAFHNDASWSLDSGDAT